MIEKITSRRNPNIVRLRKLASSRSFRRENRAFVCEGKKLFYEAVMWDADIESVFVCDGFDGDIPPNIQIFHLSRDILEYASSQKNPQDIIFICKIPGTSNPLDIKGKNILLENIQDPGNLGTILRSADAFGINSIILLGECSDPYNLKSVRASMGAVFRCNIIEIKYEELDRYLKSGLILYGASLSDRSRNITEIDLKGVTVAVGNEGGGLSDRIMNMCSEHIIIPITEQCESLNAGVAASVIMWEMAKANM